MRRDAMLATAVFVAAAGLAGCFGGDEAPSDEVYVQAQDARFTPYWAYNGTGAVRADFPSFMALSAKDSNNSGVAAAVVSLDGHVWTIVMDRYAQQGNRSFQDGGIARRLFEHGATGVADTSIPRVFVEVAAWGFANVSIDGTQIRDPYTDDKLWVAHYMVITTGVRDAETLGIWNQAKTAPYDPARPEDGYAEEGDRELHLVLKSRMERPDELMAIQNVTGSVNNPLNFQREQPVYINPVPGTWANLSIGTEGPMGGQADLTFRFKDPNGTVVATARAGHGVAGEDSRFTGRAEFRMDKIGTYQVNITGTGLGATYRIAGTVLPAGVLNFWWEDWVMADRADALPTDFMTPPPT